MTVAHDPGVDLQPNEERARRAGEAIRRAREAKGLKQPQLAQAMTEALELEQAPGRARTVSQPAVSRWELGQNVPEQWKLPVIEQVLDIPSGTLAAILYDRQPRPVEDRADAIEARLDRVELQLAQMIELLRDLDRRIQGTSPDDDGAA